jgi:glyoxylase-like metal-dependent hydrolase (beta-lactamase superfamily II)
VRLEVLPRETPAAHAVLAGSVLLDSGDGRGGRLEAALAGREVERCALTHGHADHCGGAAWLQARGVPVALHAADVPTLARDAVHLDQPFAPFAPDLELRDGDVLPGGIEVVATPSQTPGHVVFWVPEARTVVTGDLLQATDVAWLPYDGSTIDAAIASVARVADLGAARAIPGHGPPVEDVPAAAARTIAVYERWREDPARQADHGARRMAAAWLVLQDPRPAHAAAVEGLARVPVVGDVAAVLGTTPVAVAERAFAQLVGSGAVADDGGPLVPRFPHEAG